MNKLSGNRNFHHCHMQNGVAFAMADRYILYAVHRMMLGGLATLLMLFTLVIMSGVANAATRGLPAALPGHVSGSSAKQDVKGAWRVAQVQNSSESWQENAFRAIDIQKRLKALAQEKKRQQERYRKRRIFNQRRKVQVKTRARTRVSRRKLNLLRKTARRKAREIRRKLAAGKSYGKSGNRSGSKVAMETIVTEPVKLQRCLRAAGYFNGAITGRLDDATLLAFLAFRDDRNLSSRPANLFDPVIQKQLFSLCPDDSLLQLNRIVASAMGRQSEPVATPEPAAEKKKLALKEMVPLKTDGNKGTGVVGRSEKTEEPVTTASIITTKKQARFPSMDAAGERQDKGRAGPSGSEDGFAAEVLAATEAPEHQQVASARQDRMETIGEKEVTGATSSYAVRRVTVAREKTVVRPQGKRLASAAPYAGAGFLKRLSIADLARVEPSSPNTCSPQNHEPALAMSTVPVHPAGQAAGGLQMARVAEDGPSITGSISAASLVRSLRKNKRTGLSRLVPVSKSEKTCLPRDLYDLLATTHGRKTDVSVCKPDCLPAPEAFSPGQRELFAEQYKINWCGSNCLGIAEPLPLREVMKIERDARVHVCTRPQLRLVPAARGHFDRDGVPAPVRALFEHLPGGYGNRDNIAVLIGNRNYAPGIGINATGFVNIAAMKALLVEQLGYRPENVIVLKDARRADLVRLFGRDGNAQGLLQKRLASSPDARLLIYYSGHASSSGLGMDNYLLPVDAVTGNERKTAYSLGVLYDNLREMDARSTQMFLETDFNANHSAAVLAPNIAERRVIVAPIVPVRGLAVFSAATGDQKALVDPETGIGLFTRYLISGLAGKADERPIGNGDRIIDSVELYVHLAGKVRLAARKTLGLRQNPTFARSDSLFLSQLSRKRVR